MLGLGLWVSGFEVLLAVVACAPQMREELFFRLFGGGRVGNDC